jgi:hypothetical protein
MNELRKGGDAKRREALQRLARSQLTIIVELVHFVLYLACHPRTYLL